MIYLVIIGLAVLNLRIRTHLHVRNGDTETGKVWDLASMAALGYACGRLYIEYIAV